MTVGGIGRTIIRNTISTAGEILSRGRGPGEGEREHKMVRDFYGRMGFTLTAESETQREFALALAPFQPRPTKI
jgi:hypothetical protein